MRARGVRSRLELAQRSAVGAVLLCIAGIAILHFFRIRLGLFGSTWVAGSAAAVTTFVLLVSAWCRNRQRPIVGMLLLTGAAALVGIYADYVLLAVVLAIVVSSASYLASQFIGFVLPLRHQPRADAASVNVALVVGSVSSMLVLAEILLWILTVMSGQASGRPHAVGSALGIAFIGAAHAETALLPWTKSEAATVSVRTPTLAEADGMLEPGVVAAARRRADALSLPPEWMRRGVQVPGAYRAVYWHGALHVYNRDGLRMVGSPPPKDPNLFRVLVLGDSITYGEGIEERFTYARQLERLLRPSWRVEVINAGINGVQSEDILRTAQRLVPSLQPDLVIYGMCLNDFLPSGVGEYDGRIHLPEFILARSRVGPVAELLLSNALMRLGLSRDFFDDILHGIRAYRDRFARDVAELNRLVRVHEIPPVIALVLDQFPEPGGRGQQIAGLAEQALAAAGMIVLSTDDYYRRFSDFSPLRVSRWEGHPNEEANAVWALMLQQVVAQDTRLAKYQIPASD